MQQALRPYVTASVALVGASMAAVTPVATSLPGISLSRDIQLTAAGIDEALAGIVQAVPSGVQDIIDNAQASLGAFGGSVGSLLTALSDPSEAFKNLDTAFAAATFLAGDQKSFLTGGEDLPSGAAALSNDDFHTILFALLTVGNTTSDPATAPLLPESLVPLVNAISSPLAGDLIGQVSPFGAAITPFLNPFLELITDLQDKTTPDIGALGQELLQAPLNSFFGFFNGTGDAPLDLDPLLPLIAKADILPPDFSIDHLSLAFGGLFAPGETAGGFGSADGGATPGAGGSILNMLGVDTILNIPGHGVGPIGGDAGLIYAISQALMGNLPPLQPDTDGTDDAGTTAALSDVGDTHGAENLADLLGI